MTYAWHNSPELKAEVTERMILHRYQDSIVQGVFQRYAPEVATKYKGCLIGCLLPKVASGKDPLPAIGWHQEVEIQYGIIEAVGNLLDRIFENLPHGAHAKFAVDSIKAIPVGADLFLVPSRLVLHALSELWSVEPVINGLLEHVVALYQRRVNGDEPTRAEWLLVKEAAREYPARHLMANIIATAAWFCLSDTDPDFYAAVIDHMSEDAVGHNWWTQVSKDFLQYLREAPVVGPSLKEEDSPWMLKQLI